MVLLTGILSAAVGVFTRPRSYFAENRDEAGFGFSLAFATVMGLAAGVIGSLVDGAGLRARIGYGMTGEVLGGIGAAIVIAFVVGALVHLVAVLSGGASDNYPGSVRITCLAMVVWPVANAVGFYEPLSAVALLYGAILIGLGIAEMHRTTTTRALATLTATLIVLVGGFYFAARQVQRSIFRDASVRIEQQAQQTQELLRKAAEAQAEAGAKPAASPSGTGDNEPAANPGGEPAAGQDADAGDEITLPLRVRSVPAGAQVNAVATGAKLGVTPFTWRVRKGAGPIELRFSLPGYVEQVEKVDGDVQAEVLVRLPANESNGPDNNGAAQP